MMTFGLKTPGRRHLLKTGIAIALAVATGVRAQPQVKLSKQQAEYEDQPRDIRMCATCSFFEAPKSCKVVEGEVSPKGWCNLFALVD